MLNQLDSIRSVRRPAHLVNVQSLGLDIGGLLGQVSDGRSSLGERFSELGLFLLLVLGQAGLVALKDEQDGRRLVRSGREDGSDIMSRLELSDPIVITI